MRLALLSLALVASASVPTYARGPDDWVKLAQRSELSRWTSCIDEQSETLLSDFIDNFGRLPNLSDPEKRPTSAQLFPRVLAACEALMAGNGWEAITDKRFVQLVSAAALRFRQVEARIHDDINQSQI